MGWIRRQEPVAPQAGGASAGRNTFSIPMLEISKPGPNAISAWGECEELGWEGLPLVVTMLAQNGGLLLDQIFVGQMVDSTAALAAVGIANTVYCLWWLAVVGAESALDTLSSQAWGGGDRAALYRWGAVCGVTLCVLSGVGGVLLAGGGALARGLLAADEETSALVGTFCTALIPGTLPLALAVTMLRMMQVQGRVMPGLVISAATFGVNLCSKPLLIYSMGFPGAAISTTLSRVFMLLATGAFVRWRPFLPESGMTLRKFLWNIPEYWSARGTFLVLSAHGAVTMGLESLALTATTIITGLLGEDEVAVHSSLLTVTGATFCVPLGLGIASSIRVGHLLGAQDVERAQLSARLAVGMGAGFTALCGVLFLAARNHIGNLFSDDAGVVALFATLVPVVALFQMFDGILAAAAGALRGMGRQRQLVAFYAAGIWLVGVTASWALALPAGGGLTGVWAGITGGVAAAAGAAAVTLGRVDWAQEAHEAAKAAAQSALVATSAGGTPDDCLSLAAAGAGKGSGGSSGATSAASSRSASVGGDGDGVVDSGGGGGGENGGDHAMLC